jgi:hypothetical protein
MEKTSVYIQAFFAIPPPPPHSTLLGMILALFEGKANVL